MINRPTLLLAIPNAQDGTTFRRPSPLVPPTLSSVELKRASRLMMPMPLISPVDEDSAAILSRSGMRAKSSIRTVDICNVNTLIEQDLNMQVSRKEIREKQKAKKAKCTKCCNVM